MDHFRIHSRHDRDARIVDGSGCGWRGIFVLASSKAYATILFPTLLVLVTPMSRSSSEEKNLHKLHLSRIVEVGWSVGKITGVIEASFASCRFWRKSLRSVLVAAITTIRTYCGSGLSPKHLDLSSDYGYTTEASSYRRPSQPLGSSGVRHLIGCGRFEQSSFLNGRHHAAKAANAS